MLFVCKLSFVEMAISSLPKSEIRNTSNVRCTPSTAGEQNVCLDDNLASSPDSLALVLSGAQDKTSARESGDQAR